MKKIAIVLILLAGSCLSSFATDQNPYRKFKAEHWDTKNGMPNDLILNVYQTMDGFIWTTSYSGLTRFDGINFTSFNSRTVPQMKTDNIETLLYETNDSTLWIPTPNSGLLSFKNGVFEAFLTDATSLYISGKTENEELLIAIGRGTPVFVLFDTHTKIFKELDQSQLLELYKKGKLKGYDFDYDRSGNCWCFFNRKLYRINNGEFHELTPKEGYYPGRGYYDIYADSKNRVWLVSRMGMFLWNGQKFELYPGMEDAGFIYTSASTGLMLEDIHGGVWAATMSGITYLAPESDRFVFYPKSQSLLAEPLNNIIEDKEGNIWLSSSNGLTKISQSKFINYSKVDGLDDSRLAAVCALDNNSYLLGTNRKFFLVENGVLKPYSFKTRNLTGDPIQIFKDSRDNIWICTTSGKVLRISKKGEKLFLPKDNYQARYVIEDENHDIYFAFAYGGIGYLNKEDQIELLDLPKIDFKSLFISSILKLHNGNWLITTFNKGIVIIDKEGNPTYNDDKSGLPTIGVFSSTEDIDGTIWLTTQSGLTRYKNGEFAHIDFKSGLPTNSLFEFIPDHLGYVWFPSSRGLIRAQKKELNDYLDKKIDTIDWQLYDDGDGMLNRQCVGARHSSVTPDGRLLFVTFGGLVEVDPNQITKNPVPPSVVIHQVMCDNEDAGLDQNKTFKPGNHRYIFEYSGLSLVAPQKVQFKFKLIGYDKNWISAVGDRKAFYTNIPSGNYTFRVIACNNDGVWNTEGASYSFKVASFFYETTWFRILLVIALSFLIWLIVKWKTSAARKQNEILEAEVALRTIDLNKANSELNQSLNNLKATQSQLIQSEKMASLGELTAGIAHEIQNPLNFVNNFSEVNNELIDELNEELDKGDIDEVKAISKDIKENGQKILHHGKRADAIVKGMLQHSRTSSGVKELTDINALADEYLRLSYHGLRAKDKSFNSDFKTEFDESLPKINVIPQDIGRVLLNLINNAFYAVDKRAKETTPQPPKGGAKNDQTEYRPTVIIRTASSKSPLGGLGVILTVNDNGGGINKNIIDKIFQPFFTTKPTGSGTGLGLSLSYDIIKVHGGEIKVESKEGEGTEFIIQIPIS